MNEALIKEIFSDEAFLKSLAEMETAEEVQAALKEKGLDLSIDDILKIQKTLTSQENGELSEDEMENVAGGFAITAGIVSAIAGVIGATASGGTFVHTFTRGRW